MKSKTKPRPKPKIGKGFASSLAKATVNNAVRPYVPYNADLFYTPVG